MKKCEGCGAEILVGASFCPQCGRKVASEAPDEISASVRGLLSEAKVLTAKGNYVDAIAKCTQALRVQPSDPEVRSVLGDVYEAQGRLDEAAKWYQMAIDLRVDCAQDEAKLTAVRARLAKGKRGPKVEVTGHSLQVRPGAGPFDAVLRYVIITGILAVIVLLIYGLLVYLIQIGNQRNTTLPATSFNKSRVRAKSQSHGGGTPGDDSLVPAIGVVVHPKKERDILYAVATSQAVRQNKLVVDNVSLDPRGRPMVITFRMVAPPSPLTNSQVLRYAAVVSAPAFRASPGTTVVTVKALMNVRGKKGKKETMEPALVLVCDMHKSSVDYSRATDAQLRKMATQVWWRSKVEK